MRHWSLRSIDGPMKSIVDTVCAAAGVLALLCTSAAQANCYAVYKGRDQIYYAQTPPVDTSLHYSDTVPARFGPGATMVVASSYDCPSDDESLGNDTWSRIFPATRSSRAS